MTKYVQLDELSTQLVGLTKKAVHLADQNNPSIQLVASVLLNKGFFREKISIFSS